MYLIKMLGADLFFPIFKRLIRIINYSRFAIDISSIAVCFKINNIG